jgi:hypothetical protein
MPPPKPFDPPPGVRKKTPSLSKIADQVPPKTVLGSEYPGYCT